MSSLQRKGIGVAASQKYEDMLLSVGGQQHHPVSLGQGSALAMRASALMHARSAQRWAPSCCLLQQSWMHTDMDHSILLSVVQPVGAEAAADIDKDLGRTFPSMRRFATAEGQDTLRRVLRAYAALDPEVRSCGCAQAFCLGAHSNRRAVCACNVVGALPTWASQQSCCLLALSSRRHVCLRTLTGALSVAHTVGAMLCAHNRRRGVCMRTATCSRCDLAGAGPTCQQRTGERRRLCATERAHMRCCRACSTVRLQARSVACIGHAHCTVPLCMC
jgi:hypothetical protein